MPTQQEYNIIKQRVRDLYINIDVLNYKFEQVGTLNGNIIDTPNFTNDSTSNIRRTANLKILVTDSSFDIAYGGKLWIDKYLRISIGIKDIQTKEVVWTKMGIYYINNPSKDFSYEGNTISFSCSDLMGKMTNTMGNTMNGIKIPANSNVRNVIISTIEQQGITKYIVDECKYDNGVICNVLNDINVEVGGSAFDVLEQLLNIIPNYQMYFDVDGVFHYNKIPTGDNEQIMVDDDLWKDTLVSYSQEYDYSSIRNVIEVIGGTHDNFIGCTFTSANDNVFNVTTSRITTLEDGMQFGLSISIRSTKQLYLNVNDLGAKPIIYENGEIVTNTSTESDSELYIFSYNSNLDSFIFLGGLFPYAIVKDTNKISPFYIGDNEEKSLRIVLSGSDYDNIWSDILAKQMANYEFYNRCRLKDSVTINIVPIYWLDTNWLIEITLPNKNGIEETNKYLIKSISTSFDTNSTQSIVLMRYYPEYNKD